MSPCHPVLLMAALLTCLAQSAAGQESQSEFPSSIDEEYEAYAAKLSKELPEREFTIKTAPPMKVKFTRPDPKLLDNKFFAELRLRVTDVDPNDEKSMERYHHRLTLFTNPKTRPALELQLQGSNPWQVLYPDPAPFDSKSLPLHFQSLVDRTPADSRPDKELITYLTSSDCGRDVGWSGNSLPRKGTAIEFRFIYLGVSAPTQELAAARARAIVRLYDAGFSRPAQKYLLGECKKEIEAARAEYAMIAQREAAIAVEHEKLSKPSEITEDILKELKAQKVMVAIELAGLNARVKACDSMLEEPAKLGVSALQSVSDMKVKAEVERVGIKEKLDTINKYIVDGDARDATGRKASQLRSELNNLVNEAYAKTRTVNSRFELLKLFEPFEIPDNQITIAPLEWTE